jgi:CheY-like chemotaxis protein
MRPRRLLYIEDDDAAYFLVEIALREADPRIELFQASDGEEALAFLRQSGSYEGTPRPDLILLDLNLPKKDGFEVLRSLKASESLRSIPVIVFTTSSRASDRDDSLALGAQEYIVKPPTLNALMEAVKVLAQATGK